jgi:deoxyribodipyrimidine photo-lyase
MNTLIVVCWLRRDLRLNDNAALYHALKCGHQVLPVFIFDKNILDKLDNKKDKRVDFIHQTITELKTKLQSKGSDILVYYQSAEEAWKQITEQYNVHAVYTNHDYEPYGIERDEIIKNLLTSKGITFHSYKDQCIFEKDEITKDDGKPYTVFTPYSKKWKARLTDFYIKEYPCDKYFGAFYPINQTLPLPSLKEMGFGATNATFPSTEVAQVIIKNYDKTRNFPAIHGTSRLGIHLRFGTISIREKATKALSLNETFLNELIWRDFYMMILYHFPHVATRSFRKEYDSIEWRNNEADFGAWCQGKTGYPIVDAGMRELNTTGYMHNRVRMIVASFLTKHLLIDWRWGEAYFAQKLLDFDLSANNGGWQWAAGSGTDAAPYFRVFNPALQTEKFDKQGEYIKKWVPELLTPDYPKPIVQHEMARKRCLEVYKAALSSK